jgi:actin-binding LIM protein
VSDCRLLLDRLSCSDCAATGIDRMCLRCDEMVIGPGQRFENCWFHREHFACEECGNELKQNTAVLVGGTLKCRGCVAEERGKCRKCRGDVGSDKTTACGAVWHPRCFVCQVCAITCTKRRFVNIGGSPCCERCFDRLASEGRLDRRRRILPD